MLYSTFKIFCRRFSIAGLLKLFSNNTPITTDQRHIKLLDFKQTKKEVKNKSRV